MFKTTLPAALAATVLLAGAAQAQAPAAAPAVAAAAEPAAARTVTLPRNTEILVTPNDTISSKTARVGDKFRIATLEDVLQDGFVVIPKGTVGEASVSYQTNKGAFGKSGKFEIEYEWLELNGRKIPLTGRFRVEGDGNTGATVGAVVAVGIFAAFVTGHSANLTNGQKLHTHTADAVTFTIPAGATPVANTPIAAPAAPAAPAK
jgi:hypothetical protein